MSDRTDAIVEEVMQEYEQRRARQQLLGEAPRSPEALAKRTAERVVGQRQAARTLAVAFRHHGMRTRLLRAGGAEAAQALPRNQVLLIGPTGSGKTLLVRTMAELTELPFVAADTSQFTETGYVGTSAEDLCRSLLTRAEGKFATAETGILFLDEIDKTRARSVGGGRDVSGEGAQECLLSIIDGGYLQVEFPGRGQPGSAKRTFNTGNLQVVAAGAFSGLEEIVARRVEGVRHLGFGVQDRRPHAEQDSEVLRQVIPQDLIEYGLKPELVGRFRTICVLDDLCESDLLAILCDLETGPVRMAQQLAELEGFRLNFHPALLQEITRRAMATRLGARYLQGLVQRATERVFFEMPSKVSHHRTSNAVVMLGPQSLVDGTYEVNWVRETTASSSEVTAGPERFDERDDYADTLSAVGQAG
jgi:ATP-dependent Clp protease ATP-binding subunit ClpX